MQNNTILLAQLNPIVADIEYNYNKALECIKQAQKKGIKLVVFPELFLLGYPPVDIIERYPLIVEENIKYLEKLALECKDISVLIGFCEFNKQKFGKKYFNSVAYINNTKIEKI